MFVDVGNDFSIQYLDDEGDTITLKTDIELNEAFRVAQSQQNSEPYIVRLFVGGVEHLEDSVEVPSQPPVPSVQEQAQPSANCTVNEENILNNFEKQISLLLSVVQKFITENCATIPDQLTQASLKCRDQIIGLKTAVETANFSLEDQLKRIKAEIIRLTMELQKQYLLVANRYPGTVAAQPGNSEEHPSEAIPTNLDPVVEKPLHHSVVSSVSNAEALARSIPMDDFQMVEKSVVDLPPDSAMKDLEQLEGMGFIDRKKNISLLAQHEGNLIAVIEALLSEEPNI